MSLQAGISVIVLTSPGREHNLSACLRSLMQQACSPQQVILVDDGSVGGETVYHQFKSHLPLEYHWRPHDFRLAYSRNLGATQARYHYLVFLDSDMVLNPRALGYYLVYANALPDCAIYGYHGNIDQDLDHYRSALLDQHMVHIEDQRFPWLGEQGLGEHPHLRLRPADFAWSANFGISQSQFWSVKGFDQQRFRYWGFEDLDLAYRLQNQGIALHFSLDVWAEASPHPPAWGSVDKHHNHAQITPATRPPENVLVLNDQAGSGLWQNWLTHYGPQRQRSGNVLFED